MINLLEETVMFMEHYKLTPNDVGAVVIDGECRMSWEEFAELAGRSYDNGYGSQEVNPALMIVGRNWWMERHEYDGAEGWQIKRMPDVVGLEHKVPKSLFQEDLYNDC